MAGIAQRVAAQFARPHGVVAPVVGVFLNTVNAGINRAAVEALDVRPGERVLDVGFGGGVALAMLVERGANATGVEPSAEMVARARRRFAREIADGTLEVKEGAVEAIPAPDASLDAVVTVNTAFFWPDLDAAATELHRVLAPGGRVVVALDSHANEQWGRYAQRYGHGAGRRVDVATLGAVLRKAGFREVARAARTGRILLVRARTRV